MKKTPEDLLAYLAELGIEATTVHHPPVRTVDEAKQHRGIEGTHIKNLFLRDKKGRMWLVVAHEDRPLDLKSLAHALGAKNLSFGSPDRLRRYLGVEPGAVTPLGMVNDVDHAVTVVIDATVLQRDPVCCHPLTNEATTALRAEDLLRFLRTTGHEPTIMDFDRSRA